MGSATRGSRSKRGPRSPPPARRCRARPWTGSTAGGSSSSLTTSTPTWRCSWTAACTSSRPGSGFPGSAAEATNYGPVAAGGTCFYWLHTHTADGIIHIESPVDRVYTLGEFFDEWHQPLSATQVGGVHGRITAFFNGKPWKQSVRSIPLLPHALIQFNIGEPAPPLMTINWTGTGL